MKARMKMSNFWLNRKNEKVTIESLQAENATLRNELMEAERTAEQGYAEAYEIICDLRNRLDAQGKSSILKHFPPSNTISPSVKITDKDLSYKTPDDLEVRLYNEYEQKVKEAREYIVDKVDEFLTMKCAEMTPHEVREKYTPQQIVDEATK